MKGLIPTIKHFFKKHGATVLTITGSVGVVVTAVAAAKATPTAMKLLEAEEKRKGEELTIMEKVKTAAPAYIPSVLIGGSTIACIIGAHSINKRQQAALVGLYTLADSTLKEYKKAALETLGEEEAGKIDKAIIESHYDKDNPGGDTADDVLFDMYSMRFLPPELSFDDVQNAENLMNDLINYRGYAMLNEFYTALGMPSEPEDRYVGWSDKSLSVHGGLAKIPFTHTWQTLKDGRECCVIDFAFGPWPDSDDYNF